MFETSPHVPVRSCNSFRNFRRRMWNIVDNNESSVWAKVCDTFSELSVNTLRILSLPVSDI